MTAESETGKTTDIAATPEIRNPLLDSVPLVISSFDEWRTRWNGTDYLAERLGLLYYLTLEKKLLTEEAISFLLDLADGHNSSLNFAVLGERHDHSLKRAKIARKAFEVLCLTFFKEDLDHRVYWFRMLSEEALFQKVLWFLRLDDRYRLYNDPHKSTESTHHDEVFRSFLETFAPLGWSSYYHDVRFDKSTIARLTAARPQFIEILYYLGKLHCLNGQELDEASLQRLTEIALSENLTIPPAKVDDQPCRKPRDLVEAILGGSFAAQLIFLHRTRVEERECLNRLYQESQRQQKEERRERELADLRKQQEELRQREKRLKKPWAKTTPG